MNALSLLASVALANPQAAAEPDHAIHEELRALLREAERAINSGEYEQVLPLLTEDFEGTTITQEVITGREGVTRYFDQWFGPANYMKSMSISLEADELTDLSDDRSWGLVRGKGKEHYVANNGDEFDFTTRWTTVMVRDEDGRWRVRAVHFGTNHLDNPVLTRVSTILIRNGTVAAGLMLVVGFGVGWFTGSRRARR